MNIEWFYQDEEQNLSHVSRVARIALGVALILYTMLSPAAPLGWLAVLPLVAIYPMLTALEGWDPIKYVIRNKFVVRFAWSLKPALRLGLGVFGAALLGIVLLSPAQVTASLAWLALVAVYPVYAAITGQEPIVSLANSATIDTAFDRKSKDPRYNVIAHQAASRQAIELPHRDMAA